MAPMPSGGGFIGPSDHGFYATRNKSSYVGKLAYSGGSERGSAPTLEQVIGEFFLKGAQTVLSARLPHTSPTETKGISKKRAWVRRLHAAEAMALAPIPPLICQNQRNSSRAVQFNLELDEVESVNKELEKWRRDAGLPLVVEVGRSGGVVASGAMGGRSSGGVCRVLCRGSPSPT